MTVASRSRPIEVLCPECRAPNPFLQWEVVDAGENPAQVKGILDGELFDFTCRNCEQEITLDHSIRFEDHSACAICQYDPPRHVPLDLPPDPPPAYRLRRLSDQNAFIELVRIWKDSLDDGVMLLVKHMLARDVEQNLGVRPLVCSFDSTGEVEGERSLDYAVWMPEEEEPRLFQMSISLYDQFQIALESDLPEILPDGEWVRWDQSTAQRIIEALESG